MRKLLLSTALAALGMLAIQQDAEARAHCRLGMIYRPSSGACQSVRTAMRQGLVPTISRRHVRMSRRERIQSRREARLEARREALEAKREEARREEARERQREKIEEARQIAEMQRAEAAKLAALAPPKIASAEPELSGIPFPNLERSLSLNPRPIREMVDFRWVTAR